MRRRYNNPDDYAQTGYLHNPTASERAEAESQRVMAIVQYVLDLAKDNPDVTTDVFRIARREGKIKQLAASAIAALQPYRDLTKKEKEALLAGLSNPDSVDIFSADKVYYVDELAAEDLLGGGTLTGQDPGVLVTKQTYTGFRIGALRKSDRRGRLRPFRKTFLRDVWPRVQDSDVKNAVKVLQQQGIRFLRAHRMAWKKWLALGDDEAPRVRFTSATIRSREEFLSAYATTEELGDVVLRLNLGEVLNALAALDFAPDDVVYRHSGDSNSLGGPSAKGFYVARLRPTQLTLEGMSPPVGLGICVGGGHYKESVEEGRKQIYGIRTPGGKPKFTVEVRMDAGPLRDDDLVDMGGGLLLPADDSGRPEWLLDAKPVAPFFSVKQVKGKANRLPGFDPDSEVFKGEAGVDDVRVVVEFLANYLGMGSGMGLREDRRPPRGMPYAPQAIDDIFDLQAGLLAMRRLGIDPLSPPVKGQTWEKMSAEREAKRQALRGLGEEVRRLRQAIREAETLEQRQALRQQFAAARQELREEQFPGLPNARRIENLVDQLDALDEMRAAQRENPDPLAYTDPEVAALARAAYARPMGGRWTYDDEIEEENEE